MKKEKLVKYAELIARNGVNIRKGQQVVIRTEAEQTEFVEMLVEQCYLAGASKVFVEWRFTPALRLDINYQSEETLSVVEPWEELRLRQRSERLPANIYLDSDDPDAFEGLDQGKWARAQQKRFAVTKKYRDLMENKYQWCVAAVPGKKWAKKVFPDVSEEEAVEKLWAAILYCSRADSEPMEQWERHNRELKCRCDTLNSLRLRQLHYVSPSTGTDLTVGLMPQMLFMGGAEYLSDGKTLYNANIPSEEIFTTPMKGEAEGIVVSTKPLCYRGVMIENFSLRFEKGKVTEFHAEKNEEALKEMLAMDEGASMLGECAFVPCSGRIGQSGILFYNTLFDENASCHLALGEGYSSCLENFADYTQEQARALGVNESMIHEDFMIGAPDLSITGLTAEGKTVKIFTDGEWDIDL